MMLQGHEDIISRQTFYSIFSWPKKALWGGSVTGGCDPNKWDIKIESVSAETSVLSGEHHFSFHFEYIHQHTEAVLALVQQQKRQDGLRSQTYFYRNQ